MTGFFLQVRIVRAALDFVSGVDPSGVGLAQAVLALVPNRNKRPQHVGSRPARSSSRVGNALP
jgi:hypothetical protein